jgi:hypothetical protein
MRREYFPVFLCFISETSEEISMKDGIEGLGKYKLGSHLPNLTHILHTRKYDTKVQEFLLQNIGRSRKYEPQYLQLHF